MSIENDKIVTLGGLAEFNKSIPGTALKAFLASQENFIYTQEELESHIMRISDENAEAATAGNWTPGTVIEFDVPKSAKYVHWFAQVLDCSGPYAKFDGGFNIYMSIKDNSPITFSESTDENGDAICISTIPDGVTLVHGVGLTDDEHNMKFSIEYYSHCGACAKSVPMMPIDISGHNGKLYVQVNHGYTPMHNIVEETVTMYGTQYTVGGPDRALLLSLVPVFFDHYGIASIVWETNSILAMREGKTLMVTLKNE